MLGLAATAAMISTGPLFVLAEYAARHKVLPHIPRRYALALLPALVTLLAGSFRKVPLQVAGVALALALASVLVTLERLAAG